MNQFKRWSYLVGLTVVALIFVLGLTSCGLTETAGGGLTNAIGSQENGPGSGKWKPFTPKNKNQCQQAHSVLVTLKENSERIGKDIMAIRERCVDGDGRFLPDANIKTCTTQFNEQTTGLNNHLTDFRIGGDIYMGACNNEELGVLGERIPSAPNLGQLVPKLGDPLSPLGWNGCLTCTYNLDLEYMYAPFRSELN